MKNYIMPNFSKNYHKKNWKDQTAIQIEELIALPQIKKKKIPIPNKETKFNRKLELPSVAL